MKDISLQYKKIIIKRPMYSTFNLVLQNNLFQNLYFIFSKKNLKRIFIELILCIFIEIYRTDRLTKY